MVTTFETWRGGMWKVVKEHFDTTDTIDVVPFRTADSDFGGVWDEEEQYFNYEK